jgi:hypothetical protein
MLAAEKRKFGAYDDSRGLRYLPPGYYLEIGDYTGGLTYLKWFDKSFPDDSGFPFFLFEWTILLYKNGKTKEAEKKALETFISNTYLLDKFFEKEFSELDIEEHSNWDGVELAEQLPYSKNQPGLQDFTDWLALFVTSDRFKKIANEFIQIQQQLKTMPVGRVRTRLLNRSYTLLDNY